METVETPSAPDHAPIFPLLLVMMTVFGFGFSLTTVTPTQAYPVSPVDHT